MCVASVNEQSPQYQLYRTFTGDFLWSVASFAAASEKKKCNWNPLRSVYILEYIWIFTVSELFKQTHGVGTSFGRGFHGKQNELN